MNDRKLHKDSNVLSDLLINVDFLISSTPWEQVQYTVPGSMEKMIEVKGGLVNAFKRIQKGIEFIDNGKQNENHQEDNQESSNS